MRRTVAWLGLVVFPVAYCGVWWLPSGWQQALCGVAAAAGLTAAVAMILDANDEGV